MSKVISLRSQRRPPELHPSPLPACDYHASLLRYPLMIMNLVIKCLPFFLSCFISGNRRYRDEFGVYRTVLRSTDWKLRGVVVVRARKAKFEKQHLPQCRDSGSLPVETVLLAGITYHLSRVTPYAGRFNKEAPAVWVFKGGFAVTVHRSVCSLTSLFSLSLPFAGQPGWSAKSEYTGCQTVMSDRANSSPTVTSRHCRLSVSISLKNARVLVELRLPPRCTNTSRHLTLQHASNITGPNLHGQPPTTTEHQDYKHQYHHMATVIQEGKMSAPNQGGLFQGKKFWLSRKVPGRNHFIQGIKVRPHKHHLW